MVAAVLKQPREVLVVDDESIVRDVLQVYLESFGCRVRTASDGDAAICELAANPETIGLVILDARIPGTSTEALYERIRVIAPSVPILVCSGASTESPEMRFVNDHGLKLLSKPFNRSDLRRAIVQVLDAREATECGMTRTPGVPHAWHLC